MDHRDIISFDPDKVVSTAEGAPIVHISHNQAENACPAGTYLIKNDEWMTITRNAELQSANWIDDVVGSTITGLGGLKRGNVGVIDGVSYDGENPEYGTSRDEKSKIILSNGTEIWDLSGNVWEHLRIDDADSVIPRVNMPTLSTTADDGTSGGWGEFTDMDGYGMLSYDIIRPLDSSYNSTHGVGRI